MLTDTRMKRGEVPSGSGYHRSVTLSNFLTRRFSKWFWWAILAIVVSASTTQILVGYYADIDGSWWFQIIINAKYSLAILAGFIHGFLAWAVGTCGLTRREFAQGVHLAILKVSMIVLAVFAVAISIEFYVYRHFDVEMSTSSNYAPTVVNSYGDLVANMWIFLVTYPMVAVVGWLVGIVIARWHGKGYLVIIPVVWFFLILDNVVLHGRDFLFFHHFIQVSFWVGIVICLVVTIGSAWLANRLFRNLNVPQKNI